MPFVIHEKDRKKGPGTVLRTLRLDSRQFTIVLLAFELCASWPWRIFYFLPSRVLFIKGEKEHYNQNLTCFPTTYQQWQWLRICLCPFTPFCVCCLNETMSANTLIWPPRFLPTQCSLRDLQRAPLICELESQFS